jgi:hypothetical protein
MRGSRSGATWRGVRRYKLGKDNYVKEIRADSLGREKQDTVLFGVAWSDYISSNAYLQD